MCISGVGLVSETTVDGPSTNASDTLHNDNETTSHENEHNRKHDVFISYRRQTGKHLAGSVFVCCDSRHVTAPCKLSYYFNPR